MQNSLVMQPPGRARRLLRLIVSAAVVVTLGFFLGRRIIWEVHFARATASLQRRDFDGALHHLSWCRQVRPAHAETWLLAARTARRAGKFEDADGWLAIAETRGARASELRLERDLLRAQTGSVPDVEGLLLISLENTRSDYTLIAEVLTNEYMRTYRLPEARRILDRWIELDGSDNEARVRRGWVKEHQLGYDSAIEDYRAVLEREPDRYPVRLQIAQILLKLNRPANALPELERVAAEVPNHPETLLELARCRRELGQIDAAAAALADLPAATRATPRALEEAAQIAFARGAFAEAEPLLRAALRDAPRERTVLYSLQQCLARLGRSAEAGDVENMLKNLDADGRRMNEVMNALGRTPGDADLRFEAATIFLRNGISDDGLRWLHLTIEANPEHRGAFEQLAAYHEKHGPSDLASLYRNAARKLATTPR